MMSQAETPLVSSVVAVYPDHPSAERAVRLLHKEGFALGDLSIVGRDFQTTEEPYGFVSLGDYAKAGAGTGALFGGLFGLFVGAGFLILPGLGVVVVAGPIAAAFLAGIEGGFAGTLLGGLAACADRLGRSERPSAQIRNARQGGQVPRPRAAQPGGRRSSAQLARSRVSRAHRCLRSAIVLIAAMLPPAPTGLVRSNPGSTCGSWRFFACLSTSRQSAHSQIRRRC